MQRAALSAAWGAARAPPARFFRAAPPVLAADTEALRELRRRTGLPLVQCREALLRCGGELGQAEAWLQAQALTRGWAMAAAARGRPAQEGLVGLLRAGAAGAMVELNCESDFVARTAEFQRAVEEAVVATMAQCRATPAPSSCTTHLLSPEELAQLRVEPGGALLSERLALATGRLGERLALRRAAWLRAPEPGGFVATYTHGWVPPREHPVAMGTYGALVACHVLEPRAPEARLEEVGRKVAQHVVGLAPTELGTPQDHPRGEGETRLLAQGFLLEPSLTLGQFLEAQAALAVGGFLRFCCGEQGQGPPPHGESQ